MTLTPEQRAALESFRGLAPDVRAQLLNSAQRVSFRCDVQFSNEAINIEKRQVTTNAIVPYAMNLNGWRILPDEAEAALDSYMGNYQLVGRGHTEVTNSFPIRAWWDPYTGAWTTKQVVDEDDWTKITNGTYKGTSWAGTAMLVSIPAELARTLYIPEGDWLFDIEWIEDSFVEQCAVPEAQFFHSVQTVGAAAGDGAKTLVDQVLDGTCKPRVKAGYKPKPTPSGPGKGGKANFLFELAEMVKNLLFQAADVGKETPFPEDIDMTREELVNLLAETLQPINDGLAEVKNQLAELRTKDGESTDAANPDGGADASASPQADPEPVAEPEPVANALTLEVVTEALTNAVKPLQEQLASNKAEVDKLANELKRIADSPEPSHALGSDGGGGGKPAAGKPGSRHSIARKH